MTVASFLHTVSAAIYWVNMEVKMEVRSEEEVALVKHTHPALNLNEVYKKYSSFLVLSDVLDSRRQLHLCRNHCADLLYMTNTSWPLHCHKAVAFTCCGCLLPVVLGPSSGWGWSLWAAAGCSLKRPPSSSISCAYNYHLYHLYIYNLTLSHVILMCYTIINIIITSMVERLCVSGGFCDVWYWAI